MNSFFPKLLSTMVFIRATDRKLEQKINLKLSMYKEINTIIYLLNKIESFVLTTFEICSKLSNKGLTLTVSPHDLSAKRGLVLKQITHI